MTGKRRHLLTKSIEGKARKGFGRGFESVCDEPRYICRYTEVWEEADDDGEWLLNGTVREESRKESFTQVDKMGLVYSVNDRQPEPLE